MKVETILDRYALLITGIIIVLIVGLIIYVPAKIDQKICENNGGTYIWSFNQYENKCHLKGDSNED